MCSGSCIEQPLRRNNYKEFNHNDRLLQQTVGPYCTYSFPAPHSNLVPCSERVQRGLGRLSALQNQSMFFWNLGQSLKVLGGETRVVNRSC